MLYIYCCVCIIVFLLLGMNMQPDGNVVASFDRRGQFIITGNSRGKVSVCTYVYVYM